MGAYLTGNSVTVEEQFTQEMTPGNPATAAPIDPATVVFYLRPPSPAAAVQTYTYGVDAQVTRVSQGLYRLQLDFVSTPGTYHYRVEGTNPEAVGEGEFEILRSSVKPAPSPLEADPLGPLGGPCQTWISGSDVAACCNVELGPEGSVIFDEVAYTASSLLFELSGRQFNGVCEMKARPARQQCLCFGQSASGGLGPWYWSSAWFGAGGAWKNECGDQKGCRPQSRWKLAGYPVRQIVEVKIDGTVIDPTLYRLDYHRFLTRLDDPGSSVPQAWPGCQNLSLNDDQPGTMSVTYRYGAPPPVLGVQAASQLACELYGACTSGDCKLPSKVTRVVRQGITMERIVPLAELLRTGATGLQLVDAFIAMVNPSGIRRRPAVFTPDSNAYAQPDRIS